MGTQNIARVMLTLLSDKPVKKLQEIAAPMHSSASTFIVITYFYVTTLLSNISIYMFITLLK